jgi:hypothetical protein
MPESEEKKAIREAKEFLDSLIKKAKKKERQGDFEIKVEPVTTVRDLTGRRVTITSFLRQASIVFLDFWPSETVQSNWDDLIKWVKNRP